MSPGAERRPNAPSYRHIIRNTIFRHITLKFTTRTDVEAYVYESLKIFQNPYHGVFYVTSPILRLHHQPRAYVICEHLPFVELNNRITEILECSSKVKRTLELTIANKLKVCF